MTVLFSACKTQKIKKTIKEMGPKEEQILAESKPMIMDSNTILKSAKKFPKLYVKPLSVDFESAKIKSKVNINSAKFKQTIPANIQIKKDSIIWISVALGLEAARMIISPDTIQILDRLNRKHYHTSLKSLSGYLNFPLDFKMLQAAIFGNAIFEPSDTDEVIEEPRNYKILQNRQQITLENVLNKDDRQIFSIKGLDKDTKAKMEISYKNFINEEGKLVPSLVELMLESIYGEKLEVVFEHNKFQFMGRNLQFSFNVPRSYEHIPVENLLKK
jgi:hypothetical protein